MKTTLPPPLTDAEFEQMRRENEARRAREPYAESARYDAATGVLTVALRGGSVITAKARELKGLRDATDEQLADVRIHDGSVIWWDSLDVQHDLIAFLGSVLGIPTLSENARLAGSAKTPAKAAAARVNGAKGGRPRKKAAA